MTRARTAILFGTLLASLILAQAAGCSWGRKLFRTGIPDADTALRVSRVEERGGILDVHLRMTGEKTELRLFAPAEPSCQSILQPDVPLVWSPAGALGSLTHGGRSCGVAGIGSLSHWREGLRSTPVPPEQAVYDLVYEDADVIFLQGRFPLASLVSWPDPDHALAVVPQEAACTALAARGEASMHYHRMGSPVLELGAGPKCPLHGLIRASAR